MTDPTCCSATSRPATSIASRATRFLDLLQTLNREHGKTIVMVTHDPRAAERAKRTLHLEKGVLVEEGVPA